MRLKWTTAGISLYRPPSLSPSRTRLRPPGLERRVNLAENTWAMSLLLRKSNPCAWALLLLTLESGCLGVKPFPHWPLGGLEAGAVPRWAARSDTSKHTEKPTYHSLWPGPGWGQDVRPHQAAPLEGSPESGHRGQEAPWLWHYTASGWAVKVSVATEAHQGPGYEGLHSSVQKTRPKE